MIGIDRTRCGKVDSIDPLDEASVRGREEDLYCYKFEDYNSELLASNLALPRTKEADEIAERAGEFGSAEKPVVVAAAAAAAPAPTADAGRRKARRREARAAAAGAADEGGDVRRHRRDAGAVAAAPRGAAAPPTALPPIVVSAPPTPTPPRRRSSRCTSRCRSTSGAHEGRGDRTL